jgi:hypothetical protein
LKTLRISMDGAYFRPSTGSIATSTRICAVICITGLHPARRATGSPSLVERWISTGRASWFPAQTRTRSHTLPVLRSGAVLVPRMPVVPAFAADQPFRQAASSASYNPAAAAAPSGKRHNCLARSTAASQNDSGNFVRCFCAPRHWSSCCCSWRIGSGISLECRRVITCRRRRLSYPNNGGYWASRTLTENTRFFVWTVTLRATRMSYNRAKAFE